MMTVIDPLLNKRRDKKYPGFDLSYQRSVLALSEILQTINIQIMRKLNQI